MPIESTVPVALLLVLVSVSVSCASADPVPDPAETRNGEADSPSHGPVEARFDRHYRELKEFQRTRLKSSSTDDLLDCDAYRAIVEGGDEFVPFVIETIRAGDFFMNRAMADITGVDMHDYFPDEQVLGEQEISRQWLRWWQENRDQYLEQEP